MVKNRKPIGFSMQSYMRREKAAINQRVARFGKLYMEVGGKFLYDAHAARVLPGYDPTAKLQLMKRLPDKDLIYCVSARDLQSGRVIHDFELDVAGHAMKNMAALKRRGMDVSFVAITRYSGQKEARSFARRARKTGVDVFFHKEIEDYPQNIPNVMAGYLENPWIPSEARLTLVTGVASSSGKMAVALSQIYHELKMGRRTGFAKFETFPIWDLPLNHPVNIAYEAATADLQDRNMVDPYYRRACGKIAVNYNRDIENFRIMGKIYRAMTGKSGAFGYNSPTEMGLNLASKCITNDGLCRKAAVREIARRYGQYLADYRQGRESLATIRRMRFIMHKAGLEVPKGSPKGGP